MVSIIMGSDSDLSVMQKAADILTELQVPFEMTIVSAHRTPTRMFEFASGAHERGIRVVIAGAGGAAHLPGMVAAISPLPVIGVPVKSSNSIDGWDSILSILQMPEGVPVATVALNAARNAGIWLHKCSPPATRHCCSGLYSLKNRWKLRCWKRQKRWSNDVKKNKPTKPCRKNIVVVRV